MAGTITHYWNGSVLTVTSDSGTSSADLSGATGPRGPQGRPGVIYDSDGNLYLDDIPSAEEVEALSDRMTKLENSHGVTTEYVATKIEAELADYYTKEQTDEKMKNVSVDLTGYATETYVQDYVKNNASGGNVDLTDYATKAYVNNAVANADANVDLTDYPTFDEMSAAIAQAQLGGSGDGSGVDLSGFATKTYVDELADGATILFENGKISTSFGGEVIGHEGGDFIFECAPGWTSMNTDGKYLCRIDDVSYFTINKSYKIELTINGEVITIDKLPYDNLYHAVPMNGYFVSAALINAGMLFLMLEVNDKSIWATGTVSHMAFYNALTNVYNPIDANALPVDNTTIVVKAGKIGLAQTYATKEYVDSAVGNSGGSGSTADLTNYYTKTEVDAKIADAGTVDLSNYYTKAQVQAYVLEQRTAIEAWVLEQIAASGGSAPSSEEVEY